MLVSPANSHGPLSPVPSNGSRPALVPRSLVMLGPVVISSDHLRPALAREADTTATGKSLSSLSALLVCAVLPPETVYTTKHATWITQLLPTLMLVSY